VQKFGALFRIGLSAKKGLEFWNTVPPGRMASLTLAERSIGLPTTPKSVSAYAEALAAPHKTLAPAG
jgi:hypothetical protein